ncbi:neprilysin-1-like [Penaeus chinensis]|uniref:neprilysin-1-like n=1 Tax=Penaeus chinensis TaxID=139456 RepID=UPI001FB6B62D|nr:neprilysin-1-like [Penaeus chinensis]
MVKGDESPSYTKQLLALYSSVYKTVHCPLASGKASPVWLADQSSETHFTVRSKKQYKALNYGALGVVIGHEITHGFDNSGRERDHEGNLHEWWTAETDAEYASRSRCFADQYEAFDVSQILSPYERDGAEVKINGVASKGENIADNGGTRAAWLAYRRRVEASGERLRLPGLEGYTQDQLFFISFGQLWCSQFTPWSLNFLLSTDVHIPGAFRIKGVLQNLREFSHAFGCAANATFNPERKCVLW